MKELGDFVVAHPWVTFGAFLILLELAISIGKIGRKCDCKSGE